MTAIGSQGTPACRLIDVTLDPGSIGRARPHIEHEREVAKLDLLESNSFELENGPQGPYRLQLAIIEERLVFDIRDEAMQPLTALQLSLGPFRRLIKDYFLVCESYFEAIRTAPPSRIEAIDMGRRGLHDEGSRLLGEKLKGKIALDFDTARRLFTLICALHWKG
jgi:uncharacterized protein (UPF0262 family)